MRWKNTHRTERGDLLDSLLVADDFIARRALLPEPKDPSARHGVVNGARMTARGRIRTYVFRRGCTCADAEVAIVEVEVAAAAATAAAVGAAGVVGSLPTGAAAG